jgi:hypothetical protein
MRTALKKELFLVVSVLLSITSTYGQNVTLKLNETKQLDQTADSAIVRDVNGEICSMAIIYERVPGIKFYTNLSVEKVSSFSSHYTVWFPANASVLKIAVPGFPLIEQPIERRTTPTVYFFMLDIPEEQLISSYKTTNALSKITITTFPDKARVYQNSFPEDNKRTQVNNSFIGSTPVTLDYLSPDQTGRVTIYKTGYLQTRIDWDTITPELKYHFNLKKVSHQKQWFLSVTGGGMADFQTALWGMQAGRLGKYGYYISAKNTFNPEMKYGYCFSSGLTKSVFKATHLSLGLGYGHTKQEEWSTNGEECYNLKSMIIDLGVIFRVGAKGRVLLLVQRSFLPVIDIEFFDRSVGLGYAF